MRRGSGVLLHISSLPSKYGIGDFGPQALKFADYLSVSKQSVWQILPLNPTDTAYASSPYHSISAFAGNFLFISPDFLVKDGLLEQSDIASVPNFPVSKTDYFAVTVYKRKLFSLAYKRFSKKSNKYEYEKFCRDNSSWLDDYVFFVVLKEYFKGQVWNSWPEGFRQRDASVLNAIKKELNDKIEEEKFLQYLFMKQWLELKGYCNQKGIQIFGDMPIYVDYDSSDAWANPQIFKLDENKWPYVVAGVPPDYFSSTGQLWGNPLYNWDALKQNGYDWWIKRLEHNFKMFDLTRIDHFRGLVAYWEVPQGEKTAINGKWVEVPVKEFFSALEKRFSHLPVVAEDLGIITPDVREIMSIYNLAGMKILLFAFGGEMSKNPYIPHNLLKNSIVYTGTHDNNTARGWFEREASLEEKKRFSQYIGKDIKSEDTSWELIRLAMMSVANLAVFPLQDVLSLGEEARMNKPSTVEGNWQWRVTPEQLSDLSSAQKLREMTEIYSRA